jgi:magnesium-transporting ATPase (P-type)
VDSQPDKRTRRSIVRAWFSQESFWRDVTTRTIAAAIVGIGAYLYAVGAGYIRTPSGSQTVKGIWNVFVTVGVMLLLAVMIFWAMFYDPRRLKGRAGWKPRVIKVIYWLVSIFVGLAVFHSFTGFFNDTWIWPFNTPRWHIPMSNEPH